MISAENKAWVEEGYAWLDALAAHVPPLHSWIIYDAQHFPKTVHDHSQAIGPLVDDLCSLLSIDTALVSARFASDAPELPQMPFQMSGLPAGSDLSAEALGPELSLHTVIVADRLRPYRELVLHECILRLLDILAHDAGQELPDEGEGRRQWAELAAIRFGFAPILARRRNASLLEIEGGWRTTMTHRSPLPISVFAYAVLHHARIHGIDDEAHRKDLPSEIRHDLQRIKQQFESNQQEDPLAAGEPLDDYLLAFQELWDAGKYEEVLLFSEDMLGSFSRPEDRALVLNDIGYTLTYVGRHRDAEPWFREATALDPDWAYPLDNLGFALILQGQLDEGAALVRSAMKARKRNVQGYTDRNLAVYHWLSQDPGAARSHFTAAFEEPTSVDLLNALYARFLRTQGDNDEAAFYEELAALENGTPLLNWIGQLG